MHGLGFWFSLGKDDFVKFMLATGSRMTAKIIDGKAIAEYVYYSF